MNQILVTEKLYVTPELKKKKKAYKFEFILSIFIVCVLTSLYIYAEYDRNKSEETSQQILSDFNEIFSADVEEVLEEDDDILVVILNDMGTNLSNLEEDVTKEDLENLSRQAERRTSPNGFTYFPVATINIPKINLNYPILQGETGSEEETAELLKISPCKFRGSEPNEVGNFCIVGHNYRNRKFFSKVPTLSIGDTIDITDLSGRTITYKIYDKHTVDPSDTRDTSPVTGGKKEITLITCTDDSKLRVIVKCKEVKEKK